MAENYISGPGAGYGDRSGAETQEGNAAYQANTFPGTNPSPNAAPPTPSQGGDQTTAAKGIFKLLSYPPVDSPQGGQKQLGENLPAWGTGYGYLPHGMTEQD